jgi:AbiV family abortive infection protein
LGANVRLPVTSTPIAAIDLRASLKSVLQNAARIFDDAKLLDEMGRHPMSYALCILAQEEYGKAFLLYLAHKQSVQWTVEFQKALRNHRCKQLVALLMEYLQRKDFLELLEDPDKFRGASRLPEYIMDAMHIIVHEHIHGYDRDAWLDDDKKPHPVANRIARGVLEREKQTGVYVELGWNGTVRKSPSLVSAERCREELARTEKISNVFWVKDGEVEATASFDLPKIVATFAALSGIMPVDEFNEKWWA